MTNIKNEEQVLAQYSLLVKPEWIDHNDHMNLASYPMAFFEATNSFSLYLGLTREFKERTKTASFLADMHLSYKREIRNAGTALKITSRLIAYDNKRVHFWHEMHNADEGYLSATCEMLSLNINTDARRVTEMPKELMQTYHNVLESHSKLPLPEGVGKSIKI